ncbi:MAG: sensor histidine kinase [Bacteroidota bacterium]
MNRIGQLSLYWRCQLLGWTLASFYWAVMGITQPGFSIGFAILQFITDLVLYIGITHCYRNFSLRHQWQTLPLRPLLIRILFSLPVLTVLYSIGTILKIYFLRYWLMYGFETGLTDFTDFIKSNITGVSVAGARLMSIWLLAYHGYHYALREMKLLKENAALQVAIKEAQLQNLSAQLNPHFLFNSLNTIKSLVPTQPDSARRGIDLLSELLRTSLYNTEQATTTVAEELALIKDYLELEQLRMEERLQYSIQVAHSYTTIPIPVLSLTTMVENAVKHGISTQQKGGLISIDAHTDANGYTFSVTHPGVLGSGAGIGIRNLKERLGLLYHGRASFTISETKGMVQACLTIPLL